MQMFPASHFAASPTVLPPAHRRKARGIAAHAGGLIAEARVASVYEGRSAEILARRWRGRSGEIDMIIQEGNVTVFVEVKKSASHEQAALRLSRRQMDRICQAALEFCETLPSGSLTDMRFDAALVDDAGAVEILENAFGAN